jgi:hypothetical protein
MVSFFNFVNYFLNLSLSFLKMISLKYIYFLNFISKQIVLIIVSIMSDRKSNELKVMLG